MKGPLSIARESMEYMQPIHKNNNNNNNDDDDDDDDDDQ